MSYNRSPTQHILNDFNFPKNSLLKYEPACLLVNRDVPDEDCKKTCRATIPPSYQPTSIYDSNLSTLNPYTDLCRSANVLDVLFPPLEFLTKTNHKYLLRVSRHPATKADIYSLENNLNYRLNISQALEVGLCEHRRRIYDECFDELVRQIAIECSERGLLLSRVRHEYRQNMKIYLNNYLSANAYAMRTLLINQRTKLKLNNRIEQLEQDIDQLKNEINSTEEHFDHIFQIYSKSRINSNVPSEIQQLKLINISLKQELEKVLSEKLNVHLSQKINRKNDNYTIENIN